MQNRTAETANTTEADDLKPRAAPAKGLFGPVQFGILLGLFLFAAFPRVMAGLDSFFYRDYGVLAYPFAFYQHESFWRGELPLWNPLSHCGVPFLAQWGTNLYPLSLIYLIFPLPRSLSYFCLGHLFLAGFGMYFLALRWTENRFAASVAGLAYVFNGVTLSCLIWPNYTVALGWMPWVVQAVERSWREGGRRLIVAAILAALQMLSGVPEVILLTWLLLGTFWVSEFIQKNSARLQLSKRILAVVLLVAGLTAVQLLPFFDLLAHSQRDRSFATSKWAMPGWGWANLLVPLFHCYETPQGPWFQEGQAFLSSYYLGVGNLILAVWACWRVRQRRVWLLGGLALFGLIMALGEHGFAFSWVKRFVPLVGIARYPIKFVVLAAFVVPLVVAFALSRIENSVASVKDPLRALMSLNLAALALMTIILWFARNYPFQLDQWLVTRTDAAVRAIFMILFIGAVISLPRTVGVPIRTATRLGILILILLDILTHTPPQNPSIPVSAFAPGVWEMHRKGVPPRHGESRVLISPAAEKKLLVSMVANNTDDFVGKRLAEWSNLNLLDSVPKVNGAATLQLREQKQVESLIYGETGKVSAGLLDFLAVSHTTSPDNAIEWVGRSNHCPMVTCGQKPIFDTVENILQALAAEDFDPRKIVYLPLEARSLVKIRNQTECRLISSDFSAQRVELEVEAREPSMVVLSQTFYHPWRASIDGNAALVLRANHAFQAVEVPAGRHRIVLAYKDRKLVIGAVISVITSVGCLVFWLRMRQTLFGGADRMLDRS